MANTPDKQTVTPETAELIRAIAAELRKPTALELDQLEERRAAREAQRAEVARKQEERRETAQAVLTELKSKQETQRRCLHEGGTPPHSFVVFMADPLGGYCLCQRCQIVVRPTSQRRYFGDGYSGTAVFDDELFNRMFQHTNTTGVFA